MKYLKNPKFLDGGDRDSIGSLSKYILSEKVAIHLVGISGGEVDFENFRTIETASAEARAGLPRVDWIGAERIHINIRSIKTGQIGRQ